MAQVVLDSGNLEAVLADARGEVAEVKKDTGEVKDAKAEPGKKAESGDVSRETKEVDASKEGDPDPDDVEGEDGLTPRQKKEFSGKMLKTIGKKHREMKEAEEFAAAQYAERKLAEQRAETLQRELDKVKQPAVAAKEEAKPARENFATETEYVEALTDWKVDQKLKAHTQEQAKQAQERAQAEMEATARGRIAKALELVPDFAEVTGGQDEMVPPAVAGYMQKSEMFAELGYHLAKHPDVLVSLKKLPPDEQLVAIGKIEGTLHPFSKPEKSNGTKPSAVTEALPASEKTGILPSKARTGPVIEPLKTNGAAVATDPEDMNIRETIADWQKRSGTNLALRKRH